MAVGSGVTVAAGTVVTVGLGVLVSVGDDVTVDRGVVVGNWVAVEAGLAVEPSLQLLIRVARVKAINPVRRRLDISLPFVRQCVYTWRDTNTTFSLSMTVYQIILKIL